MLCSLAMNRALGSWLGPREKLIQVHVLGKEDVKSLPRLHHPMQMGTPHLPWSSEFPTSQLASGTLAQKTRLLPLPTISIPSLAPVCTTALAD